eukprot:3936907-Rhodomonas_salina.1
MPAPMQGVLAHSHNDHAWSVADSKNYGNEPGAKPLLYPQPFAVRGVYEEDFLAAHPKHPAADAFDAGCLELTAGALSRRS